MIKHANSTPTVFIVDDDPDVRHALRKLLQSVNVAARTFQSADEFLQHYDWDASGCLVLDVRLNGMSGLELQKHLVERGATIPIIFISGYGDVPMAVQATKAGAVDFIEKPFRGQDLLDRIHRAIQQNEHEREVRSDQQLIRERYDSLTRREREVFTYVVKGMTTKQIAHQLGISHKTVDIHRSNLMHKMKADSLAELVGFVYRAQIELQHNGGSAQPMVAEHAG